MTQERQPTPWEHRQLDDGYEVVSINGEIVFCGFEYDIQAPRTEIAAFIVRACNVHNYVMALLERLAPVDFNMGTSLNFDDWAQARALIKRGKEGA